MEGRIGGDMRTVNVKLRIKKYNVKLKKDKTQINCIKLLTTVKSLTSGKKKSLTSETGVKTLFTLYIYPTEKQLLMRIWQRIKILMTSEKRSR